MNNNESNLKTSLQSILENLDNISFEEIETLNNTHKEDFEKAKKAKADYDKKVKEIEADKKLTRYSYPFIIHLAGNNLSTDHIFESGKKYTEEEIRTKMLEHQYYDFAGKVTFTYLKDENVLLPVFQQHKKG